MIIMGFYEKKKHCAMNSRARRLIGSLADFVEDCDNDTFYRFAQQTRAILDAVEAADFEDLAFLRYYTR